MWLSQADKQGASVYGVQLDQKAGLATLQRVDSVAEPLSDHKHPQGRRYHDLILFCTHN